MFWHRLRHSKKAQKSQNIQQQPQITQQQQPQNLQQQVQSTPQSTQRTEQQSQNAQQSPQNVPQQPQKAQPTFVQTEDVAQTKHKSSPFSRKRRHVYANYPVYAEPNTVYYVVQQPTTPYYVQQRPQYVVHDPYDPRSNFVDTALLLGAGLILGGILF